MTVLIKLDSREEVHAQANKKLGKLLPSIFQQIPKEVISWVKIGSRIVYKAGRE